jgi:SAM-dependent methyltransferase
MGRIELAHCRTCNLIRNRDAGRRDLQFEPGFEVQLTHSTTFRAFLESVANRLVQAYDLHDKDIFDAGCGAGDFLRLLCELGDNRGVGIDPAVGNQQLMPLPRGTMRLIRGDFAADGVAQDFDFAVSQSVLEVVPDPVEFIRKMRQTVLRRNGRLYLETYNGARALQPGETWSVCYELCNYFVLDSLVHAAEQAGLHVLNAGHCYGNDQYIYVEAEANADSPRSRHAVNRTAGSVAPAGDLSTRVEQFRDEHRKAVQKWQTRIEHFRATNQSVVLWGSGGKGISFLNAVDPQAVIRAVVDINPLRQGKFVPGTGHQIVSPQWLQQHPPQYIVISNPLYEREIRTMTAALDVQCQFLPV